MGLIKIENASKIYDNGMYKVKALDKISLDINEGDFLGILGASGSGKSTLMNIIGCLDVPSSGKYFLNNKNIVHLSENELSEIRRKNIGFIFQKFNLISTLSAFENVSLPLMYAGIKKTKRKEMVKEALQAVGLSNRINHKPNELSGGQQQRVAIARAIVTNPKIILADEPTGNLDSESACQIMNMLVELNSKGKTIVLITHDQNTARYSSKKVFINDGKIKKDSIYNIPSKG